MKTLTPNIGIIIVVVVLVFSAVLMVSKRNESTSLPTSASQSPGKPDSPTLAANAQKSGPAVGDFYAGPPIPPSSTTSATPKPKPPAIKVYVYPSSKTISATPLKLQLESSAGPDVITDWYKKKIEELKFNAKSFAQTSTSGDVLNKLSAAKPGEILEITIKKDQTTSKVLITVDRS